MTEVPNDNHHDATNDQGSERQPGNGPLRDDPTLGDFSVDPVRGTEADSGIGGGDALSGAAFSDPHEETADDTGREDSPETTERGTAAGRAVVEHETAMSNEGNRTEGGNPLDNQGKEETDTAADNGEADASPTQHDQAAETAGAVVVERETGGEEIPRRTVLAEGATSPTALVTVQQAADRLETSKTSVTRAIHEGTLLSFRISRPGPHVTYRCSERYLDAVVEYKTGEEIAFVADALHEFATDEANLAWGIRAVHRDEIRAYGPTMPLGAAEQLTGETRYSSALDGLIENDGRKRVVSTAKLLEREEWSHLAFGAQEHEPAPFTSCTTVEAANILNVSREVIHDLLRDGLLPAWYIDIPDRSNSGPRLHNPKHIPEQDIQALKTYYDSRRLDSTAMVAREFRQRNPDQYLQTRGQFEARIGYLEDKGELRSARAVARSLGLHPKYFSRYTHITNAQQALDSVRWTPVKNPDLSRQHIIPQATKQLVLQEVLEGGKTAEEAAPRHGVAVRAVYYWMEKARENRPESS